MTSRDEELRLCRLEVERLAEENEALRTSSDSFGALAERLHRKLKVLEDTEPPAVQPQVARTSGSARAPAPVAARRSRDHPT